MYTLNANKQSLLGFTCQNNDMRNTIVEGSENFETCTKECAVDWPLALLSPSKMLNASKCQDKMHVSEATCPEP